MTGKQISQKTGLVDSQVWVGAELRPGMPQAVLEAIRSKILSVGDRSVPSWRQAQLRSTFSVYPALVSSVAFSPDGQTLVCGYSTWGRQPNSIKMWHLPTQKLLNGCFNQVGSTSAIAIGAIARNPSTAQNGQNAGATETFPVLVNSSAEDGALKVWNLETKTLLHTLKGHAAGVKTVAIAAHRQLLASGSYDNSVKLWNLSTGTLQQTFLGHKDTVSGVAFDPQAHVLASSSYDQTIKLWAIQTGEVIRTLVGHTKQVTSLAFSPDGAVLASTSEDATIRLWNLVKGEASLTLSGHVGGVLAIAFSPDGQTLASGGTDGKVRLWCPVTGQLIRTLGSGWSQWLPSHSKSVSTLSFSPDGTSLASGHMDGTVKLWCCDR
uniref:WD40 repeat domain-containing protein n=1 Tax=Trichocoleus desertorum TaxID=1481672 RepID=UPI0025B43831|nr:WD40 repeat domain-containing protein [Trichocoleus desertorum]